MKAEDLCALPVADICADDCVLFLWTTFPQLSVALRVIDAWNFRYKTVAFVWLKTNRVSGGWFTGLGFWSRGNAEICLLATRGRPKRKSASVHQFIIAPVREHSRKPDITRDKIVELLGDVPRVELFARERAGGWDSIGDGIDGRDIRDALKDLTGDGG